VEVLSGLPELPALAHDGDVDEEVAEAVLLGDRR
jgi:hypothetical protein